MMLLAALAMPLRAAIASEDGPCADDAGHASNSESVVWLAKLGSPSFIQRDWAARLLLRQGVDAVPCLCEAIRQSDNDTLRSAAVEVLVQFTRRADDMAASSALLALTDLHEDSAPLSEGAHQVIATGYAAAVRRMTARLTSLGAEISRDDAQRINRISIHSERFTDRHMPLVGAFTSVRVLDLRSSPITGEGLKHLESLVHLERLTLTDTQVTGTGLRHLPAISTLRHLALYRIPLTEEDHTWLKHHLPLCEVTP
ncbi:MAG: hypothetical protein KF861_09240 [Planctomycetaceae bacterium]|nr:hypothetical protein [Planctomycetaceae bacterium]